MKNIQLYIILILSSVFSKGVEAQLNEESSLRWSETQTDYYRNSSSNLLIRDHYLYAVNSGSLQIFNINNQKLSLQKEINFDTEVFHIAANQNRAILSTSSEFSQLYVIDIRKLQAPQVIDTFYIPGTYTSFYDENELVVQQLRKNWTWETCLIDENPCKLGTTQKVPGNYNPLSYAGQGAYYILSKNELRVYDHLNRNDISENNITYTLSDIEFSVPFRLQKVNDSLFIASGTERGIMILKPSNKKLKLIANFSESIINFRLNKNLLLTQTHDGLQLFDISVPTSEKSIETINIKGISGIETKENNLFFTTRNGQICSASFDRHGIHIHERFQRYGKYIQSFISGDYCFAVTSLNKLVRFSLNRKGEHTSVEVTDLSYKVLNCSFDKNDEVLSIYCDNQKQDKRINTIMQFENGFLKSQKILMNGDDFIQYASDFGYYSLYNDTLKWFQIKDDKVLNTQTNIIRGARIGKVHSYNNHQFVHTEKEVVIYKNLNTNAPEKLASIPLMTYDKHELLFTDNLLIISTTKAGNATYVYDISDLKYPKFLSTTGNSGYLTYDKNKQLLYISNNHLTQIYKLSSSGLEKIPGKEYYQPNKLIGTYLRNTEESNNSLLFFTDTHIKQFNL
jgi:hypothetical protein